MNGKQTLEAESSPQVQLWGVELPAQARKSVESQWTFRYGGVPKQDPLVVDGNPAPSYSTRARALLTPRLRRAEYHLPGYPEFRWLCIGHMGKVGWGDTAVEAWEDWFRRNHG